MAGFEDFRGELADIDRQITHYAAVCGVDLGDHARLRACLAQAHADWGADRARAAMHALLALRLSVEIKMLAAGGQPPDMPGGLRLNELLGNGA